MERAHSVWLDTVAWALSRTRRPRVGGGIAGGRWWVQAKGSLNLAGPIGVATSPSRAFFPFACCPLPRSQCSPLSPLPAPPLVNSLWLGHPPPLPPPRWRRWPHQRPGGHPRGQRVWRWALPPRPCRGRRLLQRGGPSSAAAHRWRGGRWRPRPAAGPWRVWQPLLRQSLWKRWACRCVSLGAAAPRRPELRQRRRQRRRRWLVRQLRVRQRQRHQHQGRSPRVSRMLLVAYVPVGWPLWWSQRPLPTCLGMPIATRDLSSTCAPVGMRCWSLLQTLRRTRPLRMRVRRWHLLGASGFPSTPPSGSALGVPRCTGCCGTLRLT